MRQPAPRNRSALLSGLVKLVGRMSVTLIVLLLALPAMPIAYAQIETGDLTIALEPVADGLSSPVQVTHAGDGTDRLFIVDQAGLIHIVEEGVLLPEPFLDITDRMITPAAFFDERGLLGLAFHPDYAENGRFFIRYSSPREGDIAEPCNDPEAFIAECHSEVVAEFAVSEDDPNVADADSELILFSADQPQFNHDGGALVFGPDGLLYFGLGDGGGANDGLSDDPVTHGPIGNGQNTETALGSILRIDVDGLAPYEVPDDNPFVGVDGVDEIYAYGFRNPYQISFDRGGTNELIAPDVGQALWEEINTVELGGNYGWVIREGAHCFDPLDPSTEPDTCDTTDLIDPVAEYDHTEGLAIVGGFVYRGTTFTDLGGIYLVGDFSRDFGPSERIFYVDWDGDRSEIFEAQLGAGDLPLDLFVKGFGEDEDGELYVCASEDLGPISTAGIVYRVVPAPAFVRGDTDSDGDFDVQDGLNSLQFLFLDSEAPCADAMDFNDDGVIGLIDVVRLLDFTFQGGPAPAAPYPDCGLDETADTAPGNDLGCATPVEPCA